MRRRQSWWRTKAFTVAEFQDFDSHNPCGSVWHRLIVGVRVYNGGTSYDVYLRAGLCRQSSHAGEAGKLTAFKFRRLTKSPRMPFLSTAMCPDVRSPGG